MLRKLHLTSIFRPKRASFCNASTPQVDKVKQAAQELFNLPNLYPYQHQVIQLASERHNIVLQVPTGAGKSICYQLPAVMNLREQNRGGRTKTTIVICPLLALIHDQIKGLRQYAIKDLVVGQFTSELSREDRRHLADRMIEKAKENKPAYELLYTTPESIVRNGDLRAALDELSATGQLERIVVDEAHCISDWGNTFRPDYVDMCRVLRTRYHDTPLTLITASASRQTILSILETCSLKPISSEDFHQLPSEQQENKSDFGIVVRKMYDRPNLCMKVFAKDKTTLLKIAHMTQHNDLAIVYALTQSEAEKVAAELVKFGRLAKAYHAGLSPQKRRSIHQQWVSGKINIICATIAFGMGIDVANVRYVFHFSMPLSLAAYYQEMGRAGRDGLPSECVLFYSEKDRRRAEYLLTHGDGFVSSSGKEDIAAVEDYCISPGCRRKSLFEELDEDFDELKCNKNCNCGTYEAPEEFFEMKEQQKKSPATRQSSTAVEIKANFLYHRLSNIAKRKQAANFSKRSILSRKVIQSILLAQPESMEELAAMKGVGAERAAMFFYELRAEYERQPLQ